MILSTRNERSYKTLGYQVVDILECSQRVQPGRDGLCSPSKPPNTTRTSRHILRGSNQCHTSSLKSTSRTRSYTMTTRPCILGSTSTATTPSVIRPSCTNQTPPISRHISGLAKCTVLPPQRLYRSHDKLTFPLFRTCVKENISKPLLEKTCASHHTDEERALVGTWCTPELEVAVRKGYTIQHVHEVWHFEKTMDGTVPVLRGHVAPNQRRSQRMARRMHHPSPETSSHRCLLCPRRHSSRRHQN